MSLNLSHPSPHCKEISIYIFLEKELRGLSPNFRTHSCVCERFIYSHDRSTYFSAAEYADRSWEYINRTQKHEFTVGIGTVAAQFLFWEY
jgi:hypothetical protein